MIECWKKRLWIDSVRELISTEKCSLHFESDLLFNQIDKKINHSIFAILQSQDTKLTANQKFNHKYSKNCKHSKIENSKSKSILLVIELNDKKYSNCLCKMFHRYMKCFYIRFRIKKFDWKFNQLILQMIIIEIAKIVEEIKIIINRILKRNVKIIILKKTKKSKKSNKANNILIENFENSSYLSFATFLAFAIDSILYKLLNCWILDCATNLHVCNDSSRFQLNRFINLEDQLRVDKTIYSIEEYV
jgi:hypothetical protein